MIPRLLFIFSFNAMKKILISIFSFVIINWLLAIGYHGVMRHSQLLKSDEELRKVSKVQKFLIMGNSHSFNIKSEFFSGSINVASYGEEIHNTYFKLKHLLSERKVMPANVILSCDLGMLKDAKIDDQNYQFYWNQYENTFELFFFSENRITFLANRMMGYLFPYWNGEVEVFDYLFADRSTHKIAMLRAQAKIKKFDPNNKRIVESGCLENQFKEPAVFYFNKILDLCKDNDIQLFLIRYPVTESYYFDNSKCFEPDEYYHKLEELYMGNRDVKLLDYHSYFPDSEFADPDHLKGGAVRQELSKKIFNEISTPN